MSMAWPPTSPRHLALLALLLLIFSCSGLQELLDAGSGPAERLIRALNLLPSEMPSDIPPQIAPARLNFREKRIRLDVFASDGEEIVTADELGAHAGYFDLNRSFSARMFYFFFESRGNKTEDPLLLWMTGGPGCGSELALFYENGPFCITRNLSLVWNDYGWDKVSNIIFVDQPIGTGFSYTTDYRDFRHDALGVSQDLYDFLQGFLELHPDLRSNDLFVTGESYAGHYIPALVTRIHDANAEEEDDSKYMNLKGFAVGNALTQPDIQYESYPDYALQMNLIGETAYTRIKKRYAVCNSSLIMCESEGGVTCAAAYLACTRIFDSVVSLMGDSNYYDIRKNCVGGSLCYNFSAVTAFLNNESVQESLGVDGYEWVMCSAAVYQAMLLDWMRNAEKGIPTLLEDGVKMLIYAGEFDLVCNWLGNSRWVSAMNWTGQEGYSKANFTTFNVDGVVAGSTKSYGPVSFLKVYNAGHMVPMDQPRAALEMITRWTRDIPLDSDTHGQQRQQADAS